MSVVYGQLAAKQAAAKILAKTGKKQFDYDSDEDVEDGGFQKLWKVFCMAIADLMWLKGISNDMTEVADQVFILFVYLWSISKVPTPSEKV